jgi:2-polyprenyl-3-methyl-5-hydroxy-6-metoxy-1,4-benzoquinol methylase
MAGSAGRWNHSIHYYSTLLRAIPAWAQWALDVGCGEGMLTREMALRVPNVAGIDTD